MSRPILAAAGILFVLLVIAAIIYLAVRFLKPERAQSRSEMAELPEPEDTLTILRKRYDAFFAMREIPHNAMIVRLVCNNYSSGGAVLRHYCWVKDGVVMMFPLWESLVSASGSFISPDITMCEWRIPLADIICYATEQGLPNKFVVLQYKKDSDVLTLAFAEDSARIFAILFPEKDFSHLLEELYPKSSRNIRDIKENFMSLRDLREENLITEEEYVAKKKEMLILM